MSADQLDVFGGSVPVLEEEAPAAVGAELGLQLALAVDVPRVRDMGKGRGLAVQETFEQVDQDQT